MTLNRTSMLVEPIKAHRLLFSRTSGTNINSATKVITGYQLPPSAICPVNTTFLTQFKNSLNARMQTSCPAEVYYEYSELSKRQYKILDQLPKLDSVTIVKKSDINVTDLAALTAKTRDEFAMFTLGSRRIIMRGDHTGVDISDFLPKLQTENWTWSAHTHPGTRDIMLNASGIPGDRQVLQVLGQSRSLIVNSAGRRNIFDVQNDIHISSQASKIRNQQIQRSSND